MSLLIADRVHKILDSGNREQLLKKTDDVLVSIVQLSKRGGNLLFVPTQVIRPHVESWRKKEG